MMIDGIFGEVLFWTIKLTVGKTNYDTVTHTAWVKIYSKMLSIILPISVKYELQHKETVRQSDVKRMRSFVTTNSSFNSSKTESIH